MARALNFEEWSGELSDPNAWIEFADGSPTQTAMQVFTGWVNHIVRPLVQPLIDRTAQLEREVSNLRADNIGKTERIDELEGTNAGLQVEIEELKERLDSLIDEVNAGDAELGLRIDQILRVDQQYAMLTSLFGTRFVSQAVAPVQPAQPVQTTQTIPAEQHATQEGEAPAPAVEPAPEIVEQEAAPIVEAQSLVEPSVEPTISDDEVKDMCQTVIAKYHLTYGQSILDSMIKKVMEDFQRGERLAQDIDAYFGMASRTFKEVVKQLKIPRDNIHTSIKYKLLELAAEYQYSKDNVAKAVEEMGNFLANQAPAAPAGVDAEKMKEAYQQIAAIAHEESFTSNHSLDYNGDIISWARKLAVVAASAQGESREMDDLKKDARIFFHGIVESFKEQQ